MWVLVIFELRTLIIFTFREFFVVFGGCTGFWAAPPVGYKISEFMTWAKIKEMFDERMKYWEQLEDQLRWRKTFYVLLRNQ